ncbi:HlyD family efflux transporter periplasmic adaptor subunit (plasmid) [Streptomyces sp. NBC_00841]|uniref:HlyD family efflux transporter periplasmic adaptor subunit n=1 Tax=Streptomyces sp. NBC_00841 TaxID=2975847 RepID=UPI002DD7FC33|nr:HlyD family efflux transporter periplasmic adaptor subunit [Streptomyces sp. NBC_00841]WSA04947.1 HlyD family efflux transporter periplasmic adaptor subunit [Streptomyces sp. NBC_00841]
MSTGKAVNLRVRPVQSADLCYPVDGTILFQPDSLLGKSVQPFNINGLYEILGQGHSDGRLMWEAQSIHQNLESHILSELRAEPVKAELEQAIRMRQNAYITTYSDAVLQQVQRIYLDNPSDQSIVLHGLVEALEVDTSVLHGTLERLYIQDGLWGNAIKKARTDTTFSSVLNVPPGVGFPTEYQNTAASKSEAMGYEYRMPSSENDIRYHRARIGQRQEYLAAFRMREMCANGGTTFPNELASIDQQIRKLQVAYIDTMLVSPFGGVVTGVFRNTGDFVSAGQPVIRVENDSSVYLVGTIKYRGMLRLNSKVAVSATLFDAPGGQQTKIEGVVSSVRGHDSVDEQWDVLILCSNRTAGGDPILPLNYNFDFESTTVDITGA